MKQLLSMAALAMLAGTAPLGAQDTPRKLFVKD